MVRHLKMTSVAHQKLATLSSNSPRLKGNTLVRTCSVSEGGERKGAKRRVKVARVVRPRRKKRRNL
jgi:hypothetical protein